MTRPFLPELLVVLGVAALGLWLMLRRSRPRPVERRDDPRSNHDSAGGPP